MVGNVSGMDLGTATGRIVIDTSGISAAISQAQNALTGGLQNMGSSMQNFGSQVAGVGASLVGLTAPLMLAGKKGLEAAADFDTLLNQIKVFGGVAPDELDKVREYALKMGADTKFSASDAAASMLDLLKSGQSLEQAMAALPSVMNLAAAGEMSLAQAAGITSSGLAQFGLKAEDAVRVSDALARAANASRADVSDLGLAMGNVGPVAAQFGLSIEDTAAILGVFSNNGIEGAEAGTQLKSMLLNLTRPTDSVKGAFEQLGVSLYDSAGNTRNFNQVIKDLDGALDKLPIEQQNELMQTLAGSYGITGFAALRASGGIDTMLQSMSAAPDAGSVAEEFMNSFQGKIESLQGSIETLWIEGLTPFMNEALSPLVKQVTDVVNSLTKWAKENPKLTKTIATVVSAIAGIGGAMVGAGGVLSAIGTIISGVGSALGLLLSPLGLVVGGFLALAAAYETNFLGIRDTLEPILKRIGTFFNTLFTDLQSGIDIFQAIGAGLLDVFPSDLTLDIANGLLQIRDAFTWLFDYLGRIDSLSDLWTVFEDGTTALGEFFGRLLGLDVTNGSPIQVFFADLITSFNTIVEKIRPVADTIISAIGDIWNGIQKAIGTIAGAIQLPSMDQITDFFTGIIDFITPFVDGAKRIINENILPGVQKIAEGIASFIQSIQSADWSGWEGPINTLKNILLVIQDFAGKIAEGAMTGFVSTIAQIGDAIKLFIDGVSKLGKGDTSGGLRDLGDALLHLMTSLWPTFGGMADGVINFIEQMTGQDLPSVAEGFAAWGRGLSDAWLSIQLIFDIMKRGLEKWFLDVKIELEKYILGFRQIILDATGGKIDIAPNIQVDVQSDVFARQGYDLADQLYGAILTSINTKEPIDLSGDIEWVLSPEGQAKAQEWGIDVVDLIANSMSFDAKRRLPEAIAQAFAAGDTATLEVLLPVAAKLDMPQQDLMLQIAQQLYQAGGEAQARGFLTDIAVPALAQLDIPPESLMTQFDAYITNAAAAKTYEAKPLTLTTLVTELPHITSQIGDFVTRAANAMTFHAQARSDVTVNAGAINTTPFVSTVTSFIQQAISGLQNLVSNPAGIANLIGSGANLLGNVIGGSFEGGIDYIPHAMIAQLHPGEAVLTAEENRARMSGGGAGGGMTVGTINLNVPLEVLRDEPNLQQNAARFAEAFMDEYRRSN